MTPSELRAMFVEVRDIPYRIPLSTTEDDWCCTGKSSHLLARLREAGCEVRWGVCEFSWASLPLPRELTELPHDDICTHAFLEVYLGGRWVTIDATWDSGLRRVLPVNTWDGARDTPVAVPILRRYSPEESVRLMASETPVTIEADLTTNRDFYAALNEWLEGKRRDGSH